MLSSKEDMPWPALYFCNVYSIDKYTTHICISNYISSTGNSTTENCPTFMYRRLDKMAKPG
jgi:hypothetical protein